VHHAAPERRGVTLSGSFVGVDFRGANLSGANFSGPNLSWANFSGVNLTNATFTYTYFQSADFTGANFAGADFTGAQFAASTFVNANFTKAIFRDTVAFWGSTVSGANFTGASAPFGVLKKQPDPNAVVLPSIWGVGTTGTGVICAPGVVTDDWSTCFPAPSEGFPRQWLQKFPGMDD
jgi:Pentapeptide repeats (9 copies)